MWRPKSPLFENGSEPVCAKVSVAFNPAVRGDCGALSGSVVKGCGGVVSAMRQAKRVFVASFRH